MLSGQGGEAAIVNPNVNFPEHGSVVAATDGVIVDRGQHDIGALIARAPPAEACAGKCPHGLGAEGGSRKCHGNAAPRRVPWPTQYRGPLATKFPLDRSSDLLALRDQQRLDPSPQCAERHRLTRT